ncbi:MAG: ABC transporter ATP-binding protein [Ectothiorhodospiraceae bacterium]|nr:ABC transporter ATP-binding protein [Chromatiales bacterium]MCP5154947.1 ABC transporter ATP-binding protein [Ectothiorhodospiraceae bacterium]
MATLALRGLHKRFTGTVALDAIDVEVGSGEFFTLLGPSGCGKTTLLRTVAGFVRQDAGEVWIDGACVDPLSPDRRDTAMVFQDYAIFPHMTVGENVGFGLRTRGVARAEIARRVREALATVRLSGYESRMPHALSGGQQQRVGLARAMVVRPKVLLMDEPLSNLDAKLRVELREDIRDIQRSLGITTLYVTHDQEEALVVSDRICIMQGGRIEQVGAAWDVYKAPATRFVAGFVGSTNFIEHLPPAELETAVPDGQPLLRAVTAGSGGEALVAVRPEDVRLLPAQARPADMVVVRAVLEKVTFTGREALYLARVAGGPTLTVSEARPTREGLVEVGASVGLGLPLGALLYFDRATGARIGLG